jgi:phytoene desaturase
VQAIIRRDFNLERKSIIIIGSGFSGLATGIYAQTNGYSTTILEQHSKPGGLAAWWRRKEYIIDDGVHFLMAHRPGSSVYELYQELGLTKDLTFPDLSTYMRFIDQKGGRILDVTGDSSKLSSDLLSLFPEESGFIEDFIRRAREVQRSKIAYSMGLSDPPELQNLLDKARNLWEMRSALGFFRGEYASPVKEYAASARDPFLKGIIQNLFLEESPLWFILMVLALAADGQLGLLADGCEGLVGALVFRYESLGGRIDYKKRVDEIIVEEGKAIGVRLKNETELFADTVICAADGRNAIYGMLKGRFVNAEIEERYKSWKVVPSSVTASFGVAMDFKGLPPFGFVFLKEPILCEGKESEIMSYRLLNYSKKFAPDGKCVVQSFCGGNFDYWRDLRKDRPMYDAEKNRIALEMQSRLEDIFPGFSSKVELVDVATPCTTFRYTGNWKGSMMGWMPTTEQMTKPLSRNLPGLSGFYMVGQWAQPGGGVPTCLMQGRQIVQILCHEDGRKMLGQKISD